MKTNRMSARWSWPAAAMALAVVLLLPGLTVAPVWADTPGPAPPPAAGASLIDIWLGYPGVAQIAWPYSYIRARSTAANQRARRKELFEQLADLDWRLRQGGYESFHQTVAQWRKALSTRQKYREPGNWSPAWLMANPHRRPPVSRLVAVGACPRPDWVEIWDSKGVARVAWRSGMSLSTLTRDVHPVDDGPSDVLAVIRPDGHIDHYGVAGWNFADTRLQPGARVVAALPLAGEGLIWIRDAMARLLAHTLPGDGCRALSLNMDPEDG